jgi:hypothetical protein
MRPGDFIQPKIPLLVEKPVVIPHLSSFPPRRVIKSGSELSSNKPPEALSTPSFIHPSISNPADHFVLNGMQSMVMVKYV